MLCLCFCCWNLSLLQGQFQRIGSPSITNFTRADYQAGTQNWLIRQDERGIVYFGNNKGLLEFDGTNWQIVTLPNRTIVRSFAFGAEGTIYLGGQNELGYLKADDSGKHHYTSLIDLIPEELRSFEDVWKIFIQHQKVFFCSEKAIFSLENQEITVLQPKSGRFENFFSLDGEIYIQDKAEGLFLLKDDQLQVLQQGGIFTEDRVVAILPHQEGQALLVTVSKGLFLMKGTTVSPWKVEASPFLISHQAYCAIKLKDNRFAIGTSQNGVLIIDEQGVPDLHLNETKGLQNSTVLSICQDIQGNLWLGLDNGIDYAEINSPFSTIRSEDGVAGTGYAAVIHENKLYLGTNQGLYYANWDKDHDPTQQGKFERVENTIGQVWNINVVAAEPIICQHKGAAYLKDKRTVPFSNTEGAWKFMRLEVNPDYAIEGTYTGLVLYKNRQADEAEPPQWELVRKLDKFTESARVFEEDEDGHIWVSHAYKGLYKIELTADLETIKKINFYHSKNGLPTNIFINVTKIRKELIFTTPKGIYKYDKQRDYFVVHQDFQDIFGKNRNVHRLLEDKFGNVWFSIDDEFGMLKVQEKGVVNKLELAYFNQIQPELVDGFEHVYAYQGHHFLIGAEKGFIHYDASRSPTGETPFRVLIRKVTSITEKDSTVYWGNTNSDKESEALNFNYRMNDFRFSFSSPYYEKINHIQYRFLLEGFEDSWSNWSPKVEKEYTNLAAGNYTFKVQARNAYGEESSKAIFSFRITPPWYLSLYAKAAYFILLVLGFLSLVKFIARREAQKTEAFKLEQVERLARKEAEFKKEVKKSEGEVIQLRNEKLHTDIKYKNSQLASATMHLVQKSEILMQIKSDLNQLEKDIPQGLKKRIEQISRTIDADIRLDNNWKQFEFYFDQVHENFFKRLRKQFPKLTPKDQKLCAYLRMNLATKEIAPLLNISVRGVEISRYRLRKKLDLDSDKNLVAFILEI